MEGNVIMSTKQETMIENKLCKIRRIKVSSFEKVETGQGKYKIIVRMYPFKESRSKIFIGNGRQCFFVQIVKIIKNLENL